jgi:hypothetical protein
VKNRKVDLLHTWGVDAAVAASMAADIPSVLQLYDPLIAARDVKRLRALARPAGFAVACSCEVVRRRLVEGGFPRELTVVIRPAVDFAAINRLRRGSLREALGLTWADHLVIVPEPVSQAAGSFEAVYAAFLYNYLGGNLRVIVPGRSDEKQRILRFLDRMPLWKSPERPETLGRCADSHAGFPRSNPSANDGKRGTVRDQGTGAGLLVRADKHVLEDLISVSDTMLVTPPGDIPTTSIAWAMAAGVTVIGSATYAVSELIANRTNGLLFKYDPGQTRAAPIFRLLRQITPAPRGEPKGGRETPSAPITSPPSREASRGSVPPTSASPPPRGGSRGGKDTIGSTGALPQSDLQTIKETARAQAYEVFSLRRYAEQTAQLYDNLLAGRPPDYGVTDSAFDV